MTTELKQSTQIQQTDYISVNSTRNTKYRPSDDFQFSPKEVLSIMYPLFMQKRKEICENWIKNKLIPHQKQEYLCKLNRKNINKGEDRIPVCRNQKGRPNICSNPKFTQNLEYFFRR